MGQNAVWATMNGDLEVAWLQLVADMQVELASALNGLTGKQHQGLQDLFPIMSAGHINRALDGYILLRKAGRIDASKLLIRPALEAAIKTLAVKKQPDLLYRIAYSERREDQKWLGAAARRQGKDYGPEDKNKWDEFTKAYSAHFPTHKRVEEKLSLWDAAVIAGIGDYYNSHYRLYCQFTHAAFRAVTHGLDELDTHDNQTMTLCAIVGLEAAIFVGGVARNFDELRKRRKELDQQSEQVK
jgi:hypothetical protein